eukprot:7227735-Prymnesium_polylepis.1
MVQCILLGTWARASSKAENACTACELDVMVAVIACTSPLTAVPKRHADRNSAARDRRAGRCEVAVLVPTEEEEEEVFFFFRLTARLSDLCVPYGRVPHNGAGR